MAPAEPLRRRSGLWVPLVTALGLAQACECTQGAVPVDSGTPDPGPPDSGAPDSGPSGGGTGQLFDGGGSDSGMAGGCADNANCGRQAAGSDIIVCGTCAQADTCLMPDSGTSG